MAKLKYDVLEESRKDADASTKRKRNTNIELLSMRALDVDAIETPKKSVSGQEKLKTRPRKQAREYFSDARERVTDLFKSRVSRDDKGSQENTARASKESFGHGKLSQTLSAVIRETLSDAAQTVRNVGNSSVFSRRNANSYDVSTDAKIRDSEDKASSVSGIRSRLNNVKENITNVFSGRFLHSSHVDEAVDGQRSTWYVDIDQIQGSMDRSHQMSGTSSGEHNVSKTNVSDNATHSAKQAHDSVEVLGSHTQRVSDQRRVSVDAQTQTCYGR